MVWFNQDCKYWIAGPDADDVNKLFGIGYFPSHHHNSARFGWRFNKETSHFIISAYCYVNGTRVIRDMCEVPVNKWIRFLILVQPDHYEFTVYDGHDGPVICRVVINKWNHAWLAFPLGPFFGGNRAAPDKMTIEMKRM